MFNTIGEYYSYLETQDGLLQDNFLVANIYKLQDQTTDELLHNLISHEIYFESFKVNKTNLSLTSDALTYLKERALNIKNPKYVAKYNHILWLQTKNLAYAQQAIDNYFILLQNSIFNREDNLSNQAFSVIFKIMFILTQEIKYRKEEILEYLLTILGAKKINGYQEYSLMESIAVDGKKLNNTLKSFYNYANTVINSNIYPDFLEEYLKLQLIVAQKIQESITPFHNRLALLYLEKSEKHLGSFVVQNYYAKAMHHYQKAGNKVKVEEVSVLIEKAKNNLNLKTVPFEYSDPMIDECFSQIESQVENLISNFEAARLYDYLISHSIIFPKAEHLTHDIDSVFLQLVSLTKFDHNRNISGQPGTGFNMYDILIKSMSMHHLSIFFQKGYTSGKLSFETMNDYIANATWYGENDEQTKPSGGKIPFKWAQLILPSLKNYFDQTEIDRQQNKYTHQAYILCIDSLTMKFEGLLREFSRRIGAQTIDLKDNSTQERIAFEKLLDNEKFVTLVHADDIALFKYLFTNQGINLRNNIAHSFFLPMDYNVQWMWLLIPAILKLGSYSISNVTN
jgi:hypothetical protein